MWDLSSQTRDQTYVPCVARQILNYWTTMEIQTILRKYFVLFIIFFKGYSYFDILFFFFLTKPNTLSVKPKYKMHAPGTSWWSQWLRPCASIARGTDLIPGQGTKISHAECDIKKKKKTNLKKNVILYILNFVRKKRGNS